jgi:hypothetical protein
MSASKYSEIFFTWSLNSQVYMREKYQQNLFSQYKCINLPLGGYSFNPSLLIIQGAYKKAGQKHISHQVANNTK